MGKRTRIEDLEQSNGAANALIRQLGDILGIAVDDDVDSTNVVNYTAKFTAALSSNHAITPSAGQPGLSGSTFNTFDDDLDDEIDRANRTSGAGNALVVSGPVAHSAGDTTEEIINSIGIEVGVQAHLLTPRAALREILAGIRALKGSGDIAESDNPQVSKGDSLQQAIQHNAAMRQHLDIEVTRSRAIVARIASAMQITQWDPDGTELIEKVQRWESFKHVLSRRIKELRSEARGVVADELESILARLMAPREFAKWLEGKPRGTVSPAVMELATEPAPANVLEVADLIDMVKCLESGQGVSLVTRRLFADLRASVVATQEFLRLMNLVVIPIVARQRAATGAPGPG